MTARPDDRRHRQHLAAGPPAGSLDLYATLGPRPGHGAAAAALPQTGQPSPGAPQHAPRTPAPCPSRVETLRSPTCRTLGTFAALGSGAATLADTHFATSPRVHQDSYGLLAG
jgi:hypothetical protein